MEEIIKQISEEKFKAYVGLTKLSYGELFWQEICWFSNKQENILGVIIFDFSDENFNAVLLGRDEVGKFRCFDLKTDFNTPEAAFLWIKINIEELSIEGKKIFPQFDVNPESRINLFSDTVPEEKQNPYYRILKNHKSWISAKRLIEEIMPHYTDIDGNFVNQFQTSGFDQRLWELYLFNYFHEEGLEIDRKHFMPDFTVSRGSEIIGIEAVTVSRKTKLPNYVNVFDLSENQMHLIPDDKTLHNDMPLMWGSSLYSKLTHTVKKYPKEPMNKEMIHYWEAEHLINKPFIIAIQDFHDDYCMTWSQNSLIEYLYGYKYFPYYEGTQLKLIPKKIHSYNKKGVTVPAGFFFQPNAEHISAIIATPLGTLSKFNRLGKQAGFDSYHSTMIRIGTCHHHDPNANKPNLFKYIVSEDSKETWAEGISVFHNPNAIHKVSEDFFPNAAHHYLDNEQLVSHLPEFMPYNSYTFNLVEK